MISFAPSIASSIEFTSFSSDRYSAAITSKDSLICCNCINCANGSNPFSLAIVALVLLFCLYGRYKSSTTTRVSAVTICNFNSSVNFPCSSIIESTCVFLSSKFLKYVSLSWSFLSCSSSKDPVTSFLYLEINGIVLPSSISFIAASTCHL